MALRVRRVITGHDAKGKAGVARMASGGKLTGAIILEAEKYKQGTAD